MLLYILLIILLFLGIFFLESFLLSMFGISIVFVLCLFLFKKVSWKLLLLGTAIFSVFIDVVLNIPLGVTMLVYLLSVLIYHLLSFSLSTETGFYSYIFKFVGFLLFYIAYFYAQNFFLIGNGGLVGWGQVWGWILRAVVSVSVVFLLERIFVRFRDGKSKSNLRFK